MKRGRVSIVVWLACILGLSSCVQKAQMPPHVLLEVDSISAQSPRRAIEMLDSLYNWAQASDSSTMMYHQLLCIKAQDRAYIRHTSDKPIRQVIDYYERHPEGDLRAWAYCYGGRVYRDLGNMPQALIYLQRSLDELQTGQNENLRQRVLSQIGYLFYYQYLYPESRAIRRQSIEGDSLLGNYGRMVTAYTDMARSYLAEQKYDSASIVACYARTLAEQHQLQKMVSTTDLIDAQVAEYQGNHELALSIVVPYLNDSSLTNIAPYITVATRAYMALGRTAEAQPLCHRIIGQPHARCETKADAYLHLATISEARGQVGQSLEYLREAISLLDSLFKAEREDKVTLVSSYYQSQQTERLLQQLQQEKQQTERRLYLLVGIIIIALLTVGIVLLQYKRRQTELLLHQVEDLTRFRSSDLCQKLYGLYYAQKPISSELWVEVEDYLDDNYPNFLSGLRHLTTMSEVEWHHSLLTRLGFRNVEIATLLCKSKPTISLSKKRLFAKVTGKEGKAEEWDQLIRNLN